VNALEVQPGDRVLEVGCGTGQVTARLLDAGAEVVAIDALPAMLEGARRRAPRATFIEGDALDVDWRGPFDGVVFSFVLHNFEREERVRLLRRAASVVRATGVVGVLDWSLPRAARRARLWRSFLGKLEPSHAVDELLDGALDDDIEEAGLRGRARRPVAGGRAEIRVLARTLMPSAASIGRTQSAS
jgi:ubiquinone/menaquinone biosynthesis C-methylase UbiE